MQDSPVLMSPIGGADEENSDAVTSRETATLVRDRFAEIWIWSDDVIGYIF